MANITPRTCFQFLHKSEPQIYMVVYRMEHMMVVKAMSELKFKSGLKILIEIGSLAYILKILIEIGLWPILLLRLKSYRNCSLAYMYSPWLRSSASAVNSGTRSMSAVSTNSWSLASWRSWALNPL